MAYSKWPCENEMACRTNCLIYDDCNSTLKTNKSEKIKKGYVKEAYEIKPIF